MAVKPEDLSKLTGPDLEAVAKLEAIIDEKLQANYEPGGRVQINLANMADLIKYQRLTFRMKKELAERYIKAGWDVTLNPVDEFITFAGPAGPPPKPDVVPGVDVDTMLDKMAQAREQGEVPKVKPPTFTPATRDSSPYARTKLNKDP